MTQPIEAIRPCMACFNIPEIHEIKYANFLSIKPICLKKYSEHLLKTNRGYLEDKDAIYTWNKFIIGRSHDTTN